MPITSSDVAFKRSTHTVSTIQGLGGPIGTQIFSQSASVAGIVTGVAIQSASNNTPGLGQLSYNPSNQLLAWQPPTKTTFSGIIITGSGTYTIGNVDGFITVVVTFASLPSVYKVETITISNGINNVFDDINPAQALIGQTDYRCLYFQNNHPSLTASDIRLFVSGPPALPHVFAIGLDPAGPGNGTSTGVAQTIAGKTIAPTGVVFTAPLLASSGLFLGSLGPGQAIAFWERRTIPADSFGLILLVTASVGVALIG